MRIKTVDFLKSVLFIGLFIILGYFFTKPITVVLVIALIPFIVVFLIDIVWIIINRSYLSKPIGKRNHVVSSRACRAISSSRTLGEALLVYTKSQVGLLIIIAILLFLLLVVNLIGKSGFLKL